MEVKYLKSVVVQNLKEPDADILTVMETPPTPCNMYGETKFGGMEFIQSPVYHVQLGDTTELWSIHPKVKTQLGILGHLQEAIMEGGNLIPEEDHRQLELSHQRLTGKLESLRHTTFFSRLLFWITGNPRYILRGWK